jgi:hypothetical protein
MYNQKYANFLLNYKIYEPSIWFLGSIYYKNNIGYEDN